MDFEFLRTMRETEVEIALRELRRIDCLGGRLLEVGAGAGWQSKRFAEHGYSVEAIDVPDSVYEQARVWAVTSYDGEHIPFADGEFDVVFSSNVLEHVSQLDSLKKEMWRVLRPGGVAVHLVPSSSWRFWTNVTYYPAKSLNLITRAVRGHGNQRERLYKTPSLLKAIVPRRHGEAGNAITEMYLFSRYHWNRTLAAPGWKLLRCVSNELIYTGNNLLSSRLSLSARAQLGRFLGNSCHVFVFRKVDPCIHL